MEKSQPPTPIELPNKKEFQDFYTLQDNNIRLQKKAKLQFKELVKILKTCSNDVEEWMVDWHKFHADNQSKLKEFEAIWELFNTAISSVDTFTKKIDGITKKLNRVQEAIDEPTKNQTLKFQIKQARAKIEALDKEIKDLQVQKANYEKASKNGERSLRNPFRCTSPQEYSDDLLHRQASTGTLIATKTRQLKKGLGTYETQKTELYKQSKKDEIDRCQKLKERSQAFVESFKIVPDDFDELAKEYDELAKEYDAKKHFKVWEQKFFPQNSNALHKSKSVDADGNE